MDQQISLAMTFAKFTHILATGCARIHVRVIPARVGIQKSPTSLDSWIKLGMTIGDMITFPHILVGKMEEWRWY